MVKLELQQKIVNIVQKHCSSRFFTHPVEIPEVFTAYTGPRYNGIHSIFIFKESIREKFVWTLSSSVLVVFNKFLPIDATDRIK